MNNTLLLVQGIPLLTVPLGLFIIFGKSEHKQLLLGIQIILTAVQYLLFSNL